MYIHPIYVDASGTSDEDFYVIRRRSVGDVIKHTAPSMDSAKRWIENDVTERRERLARNIATIEADDLSDYPRLRDLVGEEREAAKISLIASLRRDMADPHYDIISKMKTVRIVATKVLPQ